MTAPAVADNRKGCEDPSSEPCYANNSTHYLSYNLTTSWADAVNFTRSVSYDTTNLNTISAVHENGSGGYVSDVHYDLNTTWTGSKAGLNGEANCLYASTTVALRCNHAHVSFNGKGKAVYRTDGTLYYVTFTAEEQRKVACHETGHSVGLRHADDTNLPRAAQEGSDPTKHQCMVQGFDPGPVYLGSHNAGEINEVYL